MKQTPLAFTLLFSTLFCNAQGWVWATGETCGNYLMDGYLCKTDKWNNIYAGGLSQSDSVCFNQFEFHNPHGNSQIILLKYDSMGTIKWGTSTTNGQAWPVQITTDNNGYLYLFGIFWTDSIIIGGHLLVNPHPDTSQVVTYTNTSYFITKFDTSGNVVWANTGDNISFTIGLTPGGIGVDAYSNVYVCGSFYDSSIQIGSYTLINTKDSTHDIFVAKYDSSGNVIWAKSFGGNKNDQALGLTVSNDGTSYIAGVFYSQSILFGTTTLNNVVATPFNYPDFYVFGINTAGNVTWAKSSIGAAVPYAICKDQENGLYVTGEIYDTASITFGSYSFTSPLLSKSAFLVKYDTSGAINWARAFCPLSGIYRNSFWGLTTDPCNDVWICGVMTHDSMYLDSSTIVHAPVSGAPTLIVGYSGLGALLQYLTIPIVEDDNSSLSSDNNGHIYLCDDAGMVTLGNHTVGWPGGSEKLFLANYDPSLGCHFEKVSRFELPLSFNLYPNPATNTLTIQYNNANKATASIYDITGRLMGSYPLTGPTTTISVQNLPPGIYQCRINDDKHDVLTKKVVVMH